MVQQLINDEPIVTPTDGNKTFSTTRSANVAFKMVNAADYYAPT